jgi:hypothetical protein
MRPKKHLLLYADDDNRRAELAFLLKLRGYVVEGLDTMTKPDLALVVHDPVTAEWAAGHIAKLFPELAMVALVPKRRISTEGYPPQAIIHRESTAAELLERLRAVTVHKRGPKGPRKPVVSAAAELMAVMA